MKWKLVSHVQLCDPIDYTVHDILQARILERVALPFSRWSSQPRDRAQVPHIASRFFTSWATKEAQEYWSEEPIPSPVDLSNPGIEPGSPALQADSFTNWAIREAPNVYKINKDLLYSTENSAQYSVMVYMGRESGEAWIYVFVWQIHFAVYLKLAQPCKLSTPQ